MLKISAVSYLNTLPFIYSISKYFKYCDYELSLDVPSKCANKLTNGLVDVALVPIAAIPGLKRSKLITAYCIGANGAVASVMLYSQVPLHEITSVYMDYQSLTSVKLTKVLAQKYWKIDPNWIEWKRRR